MTSSLFGDESECRHFILGQILGCSALNMHICSLAGKLTLLFVAAGASVRLESSYKHILKGNDLLFIYKPDYRKHDCQKLKNRSNNISVCHSLSLRNFVNICSTRSIIAGEHSFVNTNVRFFSTLFQKFSPPFFCESLSKRTEFFKNLRYILADGLVNNAKVNVAVFMDYSVPHALNRLPRDITVNPLELRRELYGIFGNLYQSEKHGITKHLVRFQLFKSYPPSLFAKEADVF